MNSNALKNVTSSLWIKIPTPIIYCIHTSGNRLDLLVASSSTFFSLYYEHVRSIYIVLNVTMPLHHQYIECPPTQGVNHTNHGGLWIVYEAMRRLIASIPFPFHTITYNSLHLDTQHTPWHVLGTGWVRASWPLHNHLQSRETTHCAQVPHRSETV